jgi:hypothetical protein
MPRTTNERIKGNSAAVTETLTGTVVLVDGNNLVVRMSNGQVRYFQPPESRRFIIDGKDLSLRDLKPGTKLTATMTTTETSVTERTTTVGSGKVWFVSGQTVILTLPNNENRMYKVNDDYKFIVEGRPATVHDLRKGMTVAAQKIVEAPKTEIASEVAVTGHAPEEPKPVVAQMRPAPQPASTPKAEPAREPTPAPAPASVPPPVEQAAAKPAKELPTTGSPIPLVGLLGTLLAGSGIALNRLRR